jgi:nitronate monooxygenase
MTLRTAFTELFSVTHPVALAPMGDVAGGALAAAVSNGGGLGLVGGGSGDRRWLERELAIVIGSTNCPWGVGFLSWALHAETLQRTLEHGPEAVMLSFGDPSPFSDTVRDSGAKLIIQVTDLIYDRHADHLHTRRGGSVGEISGQHAQAVGDRKLPHPAVSSAGR